MSWKFSRAPYSVSNKLRPLLLPAATPTASKYLTHEDGIPGAFLPPIPIELQPLSRAQRGANRNPPPGTKQLSPKESVCEKRLTRAGQKQSRFKRKLTFTYSPLLSAEPFRLKNQRKRCHEKYPLTISDRISNSTISHFTYLNIES